MSCDPESETMRSDWDWVTWHQPPAYRCVTTVFRPHWVLLLLHIMTAALPFSPYTKIHESLAHRVTEGWIKVLLHPLHWLKSPQFKLSISEWSDHSPKAIHDGATQSEIEGWDFPNLCLRNVPCDMLKVCFSFLTKPLTTCVAQRGRGKSRQCNSNFMCNYWIYWQFNYGGPSQNGYLRSINITIEERL